MSDKSTVAEANCYTLWSDTFQVVDNIIQQNDDTQKSCSIDNT